MFTFDVGNNLTSLGFFWLFLKYVFPILFGLFLLLIVGIVVFLFFRWLSNQGYIGNDTKALMYIAEILAAGLALVLMFQVT